MKQEIDAILYCLGLGTDTKILNLERSAERESNTSEQEKHAAPASLAAMPGGGAVMKMDASHVVSDEKGKWDSGNGDLGTSGGKVAAEENFIVHNMKK